LPLLLHITEAVSFLASNILPLEENCIKEQFISLIESIRRCTRYTLLSRCVWS